MEKEVAKTDLELFDLTQIPLEAEIRIGKIFREGEHKYGRNNWRKGFFNKKYQLERANHALKHLKIFIHNLEHDEYIGEYKDGLPEDDLAKVGWFVVTQCEVERLENVVEPVEPVEPVEGEKLDLPEPDTKEEPKSITSKIFNFIKNQ